MNKNLSFAIENATIVEEIDGSQFALTKIEAFHSGQSLNDTLCDPDVLRRTASTIFEKPIVFEYSSYDDFGTHTQKGKQTINAGFVVPNKMEFTETEDGRLSLVVFAKVWKKYCGQFLNIFKNSGTNERSVSVEMEVTDYIEESNGLLNLLDFTYTAICVLGEFVTPASPNANIEILSFSKKENEEYDKIYNQEFSSNNSTEIDFTIPTEVKNFCQDGLDIIKEIDNDDNLNTVSFGIANYLVKNDKITLDKFKQFKKYIPKKFKNNDLDSLLFGGKDGELWFSNLSEQIKNNNITNTSKSNKITKYNPEKDSVLEINKSKENFSVENQEDLDKPKDTKIKEEEKNMSDKKDFSINTQAYGLLINTLSVNRFSLNGQETEKYWLQNFDADFAYLYDYENAKRFSVPYTILNGEAAVNMENAVEFSDYKVTPLGVSNDVEIPKTAEHVNMSLNEYADVTALLAFLQAETVQNEQMADEANAPDGEEVEKDEDDVAMSDSVKTCMSEIAKGLDCNAGTVFASMLSYMKIASKKMAELSAANDVYMAENKVLKEAKSANESEKMNYEVTTVLNAAAEAGMPKDEIENCKNEAKNFSINNIEAYKNMVLAKAFIYGGKKGKKDESVRIPLPFSEKKTVTETIWK